MKITSLLFVLCCTTVIAQVGIGTTTPQATLDITGEPSNTSELDGVIAPRITGAQLRAKTYTASQTAAIVYVTLADPAPAGQTIDVTQVGYYYFNGTLWIALTPGKDGDFHEVGTSNPPDDITDDVFRTGDVAIGKTSPNYALDVRSDTEDRVISIARGGSENTLSNYGMYINNFSSGASKSHIGLRANVSYPSSASLSTQRHIGFYSQVYGPTGNTNHNIGLYVATQNGVGDHTAIFNSMGGTEDSDNVGTGNYIANTGNGEHRGVSNALTGTGNGRKIGNYTNITQGTGDNYGTYNDVNNTVAGKSSYGSWNDLNSSAGTNYGGWFDSYGTGSGVFYAAVFNRGHVIANESGLDNDFRIEGENDEDLFFADADTDNVGIGTNTPGEKLEVNGKIKAVDINFSGIPSYASNGAANSDASLASGDVYRVGQDLRIKL